MDIKDIIKYNVLGRYFGYCSGTLRKGKYPRIKENAEAIKELENMLTYWSHKYPAKDERS